MFSPVRTILKKEYKKEPDSFSHLPSSNAFLLLKEIEYQTRMLNNLKKWIRNLIILSSCGMGIAYWAIKIQEGLMFNIIGGVSIVLVTACVIGCVVIGLALKRGQENVNKIVQIVQS